MTALSRTARLRWLLAGLAVVFAASPAGAQGYDDQAGEHALFFNINIQGIAGVISNLRGMGTHDGVFSELQRQLLAAGLRHEDLERRVAQSSGFPGDTSLRDAARGFADGYRSMVLPIADSLLRARVPPFDLGGRKARIVAKADTLLGHWQAALRAFGARHGAAYASRRCDRIASLMVDVRKRPLPTPQYLDGREMNVNQREPDSLPSYFLVVSEAPAEHFDGALPSLTAFADQLSECLPGPLVSSRHEIETSTGFAVWYLLTPPGTPIDDGRPVGEAVELTLSRQSESAVGGPRTVFSVRVQGPR